jgi:hypothetical protein
VIQAIHETETYSDTVEFYKEETYQEDDLSNSSAPTGAQRVLRLGLILLVLIIVTAIFFFLLLPAIQSLIQPPMPPLMPALQV